MFVVDFESKKWGRVNKPASDASSEILEAGVLVPMSLGAYRLDGRTPKTEGPGAGLSVLGIIPLPQGKTITMCLRANVPVKEFTMPDPITEIKYEVVNA